MYTSSITASELRLKNNSPISYYSATFTHAAVSTRRTILTSEMISNTLQSCKYDSDESNSTYTSCRGWTAGLDLQRCTFHLKAYSIRVNGALYLFCYSMLLRHHRCISLLEARQFLIVILVDESLVSTAETPLKHTTGLMPLCTRP